MGYLIATGAGRKGGNFVAALDQRGARIYDRLGAAVWEGHAAGASLDAHFLAAVLYSIERLRSALTTPGQPESRALLETWLNPNERLSRLNYLARTPLYPNPTADRLRSALGLKFEQALASQFTEAAIGRRTIQAPTSRLRDWFRSLDSANVRQGASLF